MWNMKVRGKQKLHSDLINDENQIPGNQIPGNQTTTFI